NKLKSAFINKYKDGGPQYLNELNKIKYEDSWAGYLKKCKAAAQAAKVDERKACKFIIDKLPFQMKRRIHADVVNYNQLEIAIECADMFSHEAPSPHTGASNLSLTHEAEDYAYRF